MGWLLALDGATEQLALALVPTTGAAGLTRTLPGGAQTSASLVPNLLALLAEAAISPQDLDGLVFGQGPGAFTGLRGVCAVVQGLALGWDRPVFAVDSLLLPVEAAWSAGSPSHWGAVMDARMGELYAARYQRDGDTWQTVEAPGLWSPTALQQQWQGERQPQALAGNGLALIGQPADEGADRAKALGRLAIAAARGGALDASQALPLYVRDKVALTTAERLAAAGGA